jgi:hypothetical protein
MSREGQPIKPVFVPNKESWNPARKQQLRATGMARIEMTAPLWHQQRQDFNQKLLRTVVRCDKL